MAGGATGPARGVLVSFTVDGGEPQVGRAALIEGYSTEEDLPKILGIVRGIPQRECDARISVLAVLDEVDGHS